MSQLGLGLGLSNVSSLLRFSPLDLDPYLLFDTQSSMIGTFENPTLDLDPANPSTLDVITATRAGVATYTDADGLIQSAAPNTTRVDYTQGAELTPTKFQRVGYTDYFSSPNFELNTTLQYVTGPTGELDAVRVTEDATTDYHYLAMRADVVSGTTYAISFYIKQGSYSTARVFTQSAYMPKNTTVNFSAETASGGGIMENVGDGWYRVTFTGTAILTGTMIIYATVTNLNSYAGDVNNFTDYYGFQVEEGTTATDFVTNTTGSPKFITGATYGPRVPMILVEPSSENLVTYSEDISNAAWTKFGEGTGVAPTVTPDFGTSPDGTVSASRVQFNKGSGTTTGDQSTIFDAEATSSGATTTKSVYLKSNTNEAYEMVIYEVTSASGTNVKKITVTPDWQRFDVYGAISSTTTGIAIGLREINVSGLSNTADVLVWGAQVETGSVATSIIPTSGGDAAARTRASDELVISGSDFSDFYNASEGTLYVEYEPRDVTSFTSALFNFSDGTTTNRILSLVHPSYNLFVVTSNVTVAQFGGGAPQANTLNRVAATFKANDARLSLNGANEVTDTSLTTPSVNQLHIGQRTNLVHQLNGHIKRLIYWPYHSDSL